MTPLIARPLNPSRAVVCVAIHKGCGFPQPVVEAAGRRCQPKAGSPDACILIDYLVQQPRQDYQAAI